jgi:hypothetical protein
MEESVQDQEGICIMLHRRQHTWVIFGLPRSQTNHSFVYFGSEELYLLGHNTV